MSTDLIARLRSINPYQVSGEEDSLDAMREAADALEAQAAELAAAQSATRRWMEATAEEIANVGPLCDAANEQIKHLSAELARVSADARLLRGVLVDAQTAVWHAAKSLVLDDLLDRMTQAIHDTRGLRAAPSPAPVQAELVAWVPVSERMPASGVTVLACYTNTAGMWRRIRAVWVAAKNVESGSESEIGEYDEETDCYYDPEGWYEQIDNWPDYTAVAVHEGEITHWMPLPAPPQEPQR